MKVIFDNKTESLMNSLSVSEKIGRDKAKEPTSKDLVASRRTC